MAGRGNSRKLVVVGPNGGVTVFQSVRALHKALHKRSNWLNSKKGYKEGTVRLDDGTAVHVLPRSYRSEDWTEVADEILAAARNVARSIAATTTDDFDDILDEVLDYLLKRLRHADSSRFASKLHCVRSYAGYAKKHYFRKRKRPDPLKLRPADADAEHRELASTASVHDCPVDALIDQYLPEHLWEIARLKAAGHSDSTIRRRLKLRADTLAERLSEIDRILKDN